MSVFAALTAPFQRWRTMRQLRAFDQQQTCDSRWDFKDMLAKANEALERDLRGRATEIWNEAQTRFPDLAMMSEPGLELMLRLDLHADAERLLNRAVKRHPLSIQALEGLARLAFERRDYIEAVQRAEILRKKHPRSIKGYAIGSAALGKLHRFNEAEATIARGLQVAPEDLILRVEYAQLADHEQDWDKALQRWTYVHETIGHVAGTIGLATTLSRLERFDEADALIAGVMHKAGNDLGVWIASAQIAERKQDWAAAASRWDAICTRFPRSAIGYICSSKALLKLNRNDEAEKIIEEGMARVPDDVNLFIEFALLARHRGNWTQAEERWAAARRRFPDCHEAYAGQAQALDVLNRPADAALVRATAPAA